MQEVSRSNQSGKEIRRSPEHNHGYFSSKGVVVSLERSGETRRDRDLTVTRDAFMAMKGIDRETFQKKHGRGAGYKEWLAFAAKRGLNLPA